MEEASLKKNQEIISVNSQERIKSGGESLKKVSFLHGLESGAGGTKHRYLQERFATCFLRQMEMSKWKLNKKNSFLRTLISNCFRPSLAAQASLQGCLKIQIEEIAQNPPQLIVGSSWGGAIGLLLVSEGHWNGPIVLLAPALKHLLNKVGQTKLYNWDSIVEKINIANRGENILIVHGDKDDVIPYLTSTQTEQEIRGVKLLTIPGGDHSLNQPLIRNDQLETIMRNHYANFLERNHQKLI